MTTGEYILTLIVSNMFVFYGAYSIGSSRQRVLKTRLASILRVLYRLESNQDWSRRVEPDNGIKSHD